MKQVMVIKTQKLIWSYKFSDHDNKLTNYIYIIILGIIAVYYIDVFISVLW